ncbi:hypothetical protein QAD02_022002 [Eretmocerus hayati]|uniref:Uncharacterized protein n=1 Tax=Eretmocerus hayati TaxID=131215 RepID=A0ACC2PSX3_9HYME|nr:hypothetical protein QAD02_022002 [Eretmocerus hayati]
MSSFAKAQLLKYGWTEGKGLGKNENGITEALKPKLKFDNSGIGHKDVDYQWWDSVYDKALKNIVLDKKLDSVSINVAKKDAFDISSTESSIQGKKQKHLLHHGKFVKTSTLLDGNTIRNSKCEFVEVTPEDNQFMNKLSDEELFKACGGRTAHKGARHGLKLGGKLARVAEQEKQLLKQFLKKDEVEPQTNENKCKKKKRKRNNRDNEDDNQKLPDECVISDYDLNTPITTQQTEEYYKISKNARRKVKRKIQDLSYQLNGSCNITGNTPDHGGKTSSKNISDETKGKGKKSKRKRELDHSEYVDNDEPNNHAKKAKKKIRNSFVSVLGLDYDQNYHAKIDVSAEKQ